MKIVTIVGARPQFVKAAVVSDAFRRRRKINEVMLHTGQHFDANMSKVFFDELRLPRPKYNLHIHNLNHGAMTARMLEGIEKILIQERPDWVLVYGDTNSTLAGALAAKKLRIRLAHVEAGMRSFNMDSPEEINRIITDRISDLLFCSTEVAKQNLWNEGFKKFNCRIVKTGDVMYDAAMRYAKTIQHRVLPSDLTGDFVLCTLHREENIEQERALKSILSALKKIHAHTPILMPVHPRTQKMLESMNIRLPFYLMEPVGYLDMLALIRNCKLVITDSGGLQKEAFFFQKYCITLRNETEWKELVQLGVNKTAGTDSKKILAAFNSFSGKKFTAGSKPYGNGHASEKIADTLEKAS